jgi:hypothetical protein
VAVGAEDFKSDRGLVFWWSLFLLHKVPVLPFYTLPTEYWAGRRGYIFV